MLVVKDIQAGLLPAQFLAVLPKVCPYCGSDTVMTDSLTELKCSNARCGAKLSRRMATMLADLGIKGLGEAKCADFIEARGGRIKSPYALVEFAVGWEKAGRPALSTRQSVEFTGGIVEEIKKKTRLSLWEFVKVGNFPGIRDSARALFDGYENIESFYKDFRSKGDTQDARVAFVANKLGIASSDDKVSVKAVAIESQLISVESELMHYQRCFDIIKVTKSVNICISRAVGSPYESKQDFVNTINEVYGSVIHINNLSSLSKQCDCLVWSKQGAPTSKVEKARKNNIPIVTGYGFDMAVNIASKLPNVQVSDLIPVIESVETKIGLKFTAEDVLKELQSYAAK
jgi:NAD-dependent DNA ligase